MLLACKAISPMLEGTGALSPFFSFSHLRSHYSEPSRAAREPSVERGKKKKRAAMDKFALDRLKNAMDEAYVYSGVHSDVYSSRQKGEGERTRGGREEERD